MKKTALLLVVTLIFSLLTLASCNLFGSEDEPCTEHTDADNNLICDNCGAEIEDNDTPSGEEPGDEPGNEPGDEPGNEPGDEPGDDPMPTPCEHADGDGDYKCDACGEVLFEDIEYVLNIGDLAAATRSENEIIGKFTIMSGTEVRNRTKEYEGVEYTKSVKLGSSASTIKVAVPGAGKLSFIAQNGSSGAAVQYVKITNPNGDTTNVEIPGTDKGSPLYMVTIDVTEGDWLIQRVDGTVDVYYLKLECVVPVSPESGFEIVSSGKVNYIAGENLDLSKLQLNATFANGKTDSLDVSKATVDTSKVDMTKAGVYDVTVSYKDYPSITYQVKVFAPDSIKLGLDAVEKLSQNSAAGNGVYFNHSFKELYFVGDKFDAAGLTVIVVAKCGADYLEFIVEDYTVSGFDSTTAGAKELKISYADIEYTHKIYVVDGEAVANVKVDKSYTGTPGTLVDGYPIFTTIQQALDYLAKVSNATPKVIEIAEGLYTEKIEITLPNLTIKGAGADKTIIEWDSLYGLVDAGGFTHTTDSTQTVAIRDSAVNCVIEGVTISNYWNTQARMDEAGLAIERGLALLVQADRFIMKNSALLGIQDTVELFTGRQYFENVFISGYTDFIFGTNSTSYFKNCTIHVIYTTKDTNGTGGYVTAFKGSNKGAADSIVYGAIFDGCKFTADEGVSVGKTAIGRTWGAYAAVAVINCELGGHLSVDGYDKSENKNKRYISMNGIHPTDETVQFVEYNNTGAGAITEAVAGMRFLTAEEAAKYVDFAVIFGTTNGKITYLDPWDPKSNEVKADDRTYYYFNGTTGSEGTSYTYDQNVQGTTATFGDITIDATNGKVTARASDTQINAGAKLSFNVKAGTLVTVITYPGYGFYTLNGVATNANDTFSQYYAEDTLVEFVATGTTYLYQIIINPDEEAPEEATLNEIKASGMDLNYIVGEEVSLEGLVVNALYSDSSIVSVTDYTVNSTAVNNNVAGEYEIIISYNGKDVIIKVTYEEPNAGPEISKDTYLDFSTPDGLAEVQNNPKVTITGNVRHNGAEIQIQGTISFQVKAGTVVTVVPYANAQYASYTLGKEGEEGLTTYNTSYSMMFTEDCTVVYTGLSNNYLVGIKIECPITEGTYVFGGASVEGDVTGILESIPGMSISGTCKTHSGGAQLGQDSKINLIVPALATVTIQGYDTSYGQLLVTVNGSVIAMNDKAQYVFTVASPTVVSISALNVGTEDAPAYNKSYITYVKIELPTILDKNIEITFGSAGNYKDCGVDFSGITIADNGGNNAQIKNGSFSFAVKEGATVTVHGYPNYTSYNFNDGDYTNEGITEEYFTYTATCDCLITISHTTGNNYFYSVSVSYN